ncbi:MAG: DUF2723 domain-containing protein [Spirochaetes bacterium]|nr:DUF2723 domain-containing protein [Spirochaetota bacterium]
MGTKDLKWFILIFFLCFILFLSTLSHTVNFEDSGEFITSSFSLSVSHPPGYPLYNLCAKLFSFLPFGSIETGINIMSAFFSSLSALILFLLLLKVFRIIKEKKAVFLSFFITLFFSLSSTLWSQSVIAEVYSLNLFLTLSGLFLIVMIFMEGKKEYHSFFIYLTGISLGNHQSAIINLLIYGFFFIIKKEWKKLNINNYIRFILLFLLGISIYTYLPVRAGSHPILNWGDPVNVRNFFAVITRSQYGDVGKGLINLKTMLKEFSSINPLYEFLKFIKPQISLTSFIVIPVLGVIFFLLYRGFSKIKDKILKLFFILIFFLNTFFIVFITNTPLDKMFTLKVFFIPGWISFYFLLFYGSYSLIKKRAYYIFPVLFITLLILNFKTQNKSRSMYAKDHGRNILQNLPLKAILFTLKDNETFPLWDLQTLHYLRNDVMVINLVLLSETWYIDQLLRNYPELRIDLKALQGGYNKTEIRKIFFQSILRSNPFKSIYFTSRQFEKFIPVKEDLIASGIVYKKDGPVDVSGPYYGYQNLEEEFSRFIKQFNEPKEKILSGRYRDTQIKHVLQSAGFTFFEYADKLLKADQDTRALYFYQYSIFLNNIVGTSPNNIYAYTGCGNIYLKRDKKKEALIAYNKAYKLQPNTAFAQGLLVKIRKMLKETTNVGIQLFHKAEEQYKKGDYNGALQTYVQLLQETAETPMLNSNIGDCYFYMKQYSQAITYYKKAIFLKTDYAIAYYNLGGCYLILGKNEEAKKTWAEGLKHSPEDKNLREVLKKY